MSFVLCCNRLDNLFQRLREERRLSPSITLRGDTWPDVVYPTFHSVKLPFWLIAYADDEAVKKHSEKQHEDEKLAGEEVANEQGISKNEVQSWQCDELGASWKLGSHYGKI